MHWNQVAASTLSAFPPPDGGAAPALQINLGIVQGAVYDAVNAIGPKKHREYVLEGRAGAKASVNAAVATAAYDVLSNLVSTAPERAPFPGRAGLLTTPRDAARRIARCDRQQRLQEAGHPGGAPGGQGHARREGGRRTVRSIPVDRSTGVGKWQPLINPANGLPIQDPTPWVGGVKPFLLQSSSQFRSVPPPALTSQEWAAQFNEVKDLGRIDSATRTADQTYFAKWWQSAPGLSWSEVARAAHRPVPPQRRRQRATPRAAEHERGRCRDQRLERQVPLRLLAAVELDPASAEDGNDATVADPTVDAAHHAPYPEWVSGHLSLDGASVTVLRSFFPDAPPGGFSITSTFVNPGGPAGALVHLVLGGGRGDRRGTHLGWPPLPRRGREPASCSARTWPTTRSTTTSSRSATDHRQGLLPGGRPTTAREMRRRPIDSFDRAPTLVWSRLVGPPASSVDRVEGRSRRR